MSLTALIFQSRFRSRQVPRDGTTGGKARFDLGSGLFDATRIAGVAGCARQSSSALR